MKYLIFLLSFISATANAQQVQPCIDGDPYRSSAAAIAEPWEENTRSFADGQVRITVMDTWEPAFGAFYLMVMYWPTSDSGAELRQCDLVSLGELGFVGMTLNGMKASYTPDLGLVLQVPTTFYIPEDDTFEAGFIEVQINRATNQVTATRP